MKDTLPYLGFYACAMWLASFVVAREPSAGTFDYLLSLFLAAGVGMVATAAGLIILWILLGLPGLSFRR